MVVAIIGILAAIVYSPFQAAKRKARDAKRVAEMKQVYQYLLLYANDNGGYYPDTYLTLKAYIESVGGQFPSNFSTKSGGKANDFTQYNYVAYKNNTISKVIGFHIFVHLETNSPVLDNAAKCNGYTSSSTLSGTLCMANTDTDIGNVREPDNNVSTGAYFTDHSFDSDATCASDTTKCIYDLKG